MSRARKKRSEEGIAMLVVMMVLLMVTATAIFAIHSSAFEVRAAGMNRQALATQYVGETGVVAAMDWVDRNGAPSLLFAMQQSRSLRGAPLDMYPYEPPLADGKDAYRLGMQDFQIASPVIEVDSLGHLGATYQPFMLVDVYDTHSYTGIISGHRSDGLSSLRYMRATYTSRGRTRLPDGTDHTGSLQGERFHESASDARSQGLTGPFGAF
jgi:hypothetical protein